MSRRNRRRNTSRPTHQTSPAAKPTPDTDDTSGTPVLDAPNENATDTPTLAGGSPDDTTPIPAVPSEPTPTDPYALASLGLGVLSGFLSILAGIPAIIVGVIGWNRTTGTNTPGRKAAGWGIALGTVTTVVSLVVGLVAGTHYVKDARAAQKEQRKVEQATALTHQSAETFADTLLARTLTGVRLPITLQDAQIVYANTPTLPRKVMLQQWVKRPGSNIGCFTVRGPANATQSVVVTAGDFTSTDNAGTYKMLPGGVSCVEATKTWQASIR